MAQEGYAEHVREVARWSEESGCDGILVYTDNSIVDPWLAAQLIIDSTSSLTPLVAVQPLYMHPCWAAKMVATIGYLHNRRVDLNMVAGGFRNDLLALGDDLAHGERYDRLVEYAEVARGVLETSSAFSYEGRYFSVANVRLRPELPSSLRPKIFVSGSSDAGLEAARRLGATAVKYPQPAREESVPAAEESLALGIRVGIVTRESNEEAWAVARRMFPADRRGQLTHRVAMAVSDSDWHQQLSEREDADDPSVDPYWLWPFQNYRTFCPYLVGGYELVAAELAAYLERGFETFILDIPASHEELRHTASAFELALAGAR
jgi:alkanesulfonate monooxygenase